jgi:preprotein translocase subunit SecG
VYSVVPFVLLTAMNIFLIKIVIGSSMSSSAHQSSSGAPSSVGNMKKKLQMTKTVIILTVLFIVLTLPGAVVSAYYNYVIALESGRLIVLICDELTFSYHALGFVTLLYSNKQFFNQVKAILCIGQRGSAITNLDTSQTPRN